MNKAETRPADPALTRRRIRRTCFCALVACIGLVVGTYWYSTHRANKRLQAAIAAVERTDPYWRLEDLEAHREALPDDGNSALIIAAVVPLMPGGWNNFATSAEFSHREEHSARQLTEEQARILRTQMKTVAAALEKAHKLTDLPTGRFATSLGPSGITPLLSEIQQVREVANVLSYDAMMRAHENDMDGAVASCLAVLNTARSIADEPAYSYMAALVRLAVRGIAIGRLEQVLSQGQASEEALAKIQRAWEEEDQVPLLAAASRGERAFGDESIQDMHQGNPGGGTAGGTSSKQALNRVIAFFQTGSLVENRAAALELHTEIIEIAKLPEAERKARFDQLKARSANFPLLVRQIFPATQKIIEAVRRLQAQMSTLIAALAAERYRMANGRWPESLAVLVPRYLKTIPVDPYDGAPLRFRRLKDGLVIYSVGPDGTDNRGTLGNTYVPGNDVGIRLWNLESRRQPPVPPDAP